MIIKQHYASFMLFIYNDHIQEDWDEWNSFGKIAIYPFWLVRAIVIWTISPVYLPEYFVKRTVWYKNLATSYANFLESNPFESNITNKANTNTFLNQKYGAGQFNFKVGKKKQK